VAASRKWAFVMFAAALVPVGDGGAARREYPSWFIDMPRESGVVTAVGYAPRYHSDSSSADEARQDAMDRLALAVASEVRGEMLIEATSGGETAYRGSSYDERAGAAPRGVVLDTAKAGDMTLVLVGTSRPSRLNDVPRLMSAEPPEWVSAQPVDGEGLVAVGVAPAYFYEHSAWVEAERNARRALAHQAVTRVAQLGKRAGDDGGSLTRAATAALLQNAQVVSRWRDSQRVFVMIVVSAVGPLESSN
jgi:nucleotide-binding universal stress UspA family protein